ncbi:unnamed protein product [Timema podura]|uniref:Nuclear pore localisation protein NPL4 C-terminal domain-containing protein n=1 Tax=Timema podura TaxID=61482 RepID=A0ABN7NMT0_TIMPD|nr:unnamed protein product [Timema podura]
MPWIMRCDHLTVVEKDSYGNEVLRLARPLPVEYLLVDIPASTPLSPQYTFNADSNLTPFPVENRQLIPAESRNIPCVLETRALAIECSEEQVETTLARALILGEFITC